MTIELIYEKYGTRVAAPDESNESLRRFVFDGTKALAEAKGWELLQGCFERVLDGYWDGDEVFAYLWPVARAANPLPPIGPHLDSDGDPCPCTPAQEAVPAGREGF